MKAILLCAGYATRLKPLTDTQPKSLLPLADQPMVNFLVDKILKINSIDEIFVVSNDKFFNHFKEWQKKFYPDKPITILNDGSTTNENRLGAIKDIAFVLKEKKIKDDCMVLAADNYFDFELSDFLTAAKKNVPNVTVAVYDVKDLELAKQYGLVSHDSRFRVTDFFEKPAQPKTTLASTGVYFFPKQNLSLIDQYLENNQSPDAPGNYIAWLVKAAQVFAFPFQGRWYDIGDHKSLRNADSEVRNFLKGVKS